MSSQTSSSSIRTPLRTGASLSAACRDKAIAGVRAVAFWAAVLLPLAYLPAAYGLLGFANGWSTLALIAAHAACVVVGHEHTTPADASTQ
jgi:hypothetical protein